ncbi:MAG: LPS export ABC transporter periplasmic protein LptC [Spirochaetales bacterium]|nr:LPS export ABC transporter periplasmic protein LptC [Spirochaetales bacterium]
MQKRNSVLTLFMVLSVFSCSLDYQEIAGSGELSEKIPEAVLHDFIHRAVKDTKLVFSLEAEEAQLFQTQKKTLLTKVRFREYDDNGEMGVEGRANSAVYFTDTENAEIYGAIYFRSTAEETTLYASTLFWDKANRVLKSDGEQPVRIEKDDGAYLSGSGFSVDARRKALHYTRGVFGKYIHEDDE